VRTSEGSEPLYKRLIRQVEEILSVSGSVAACLRSPIDSSGVRDEELATRLTEFQTLGAQVISQARRRVIHGESVPNDEKLFSVFEPHTELLKRGKAGKPIEFGHMIQIQQVKEKFITDYGVYEKKPVEPELLASALVSHRSLFGVNPTCLTADKGYFERETVDALEQQIEMVSITKKGKRTPAQPAREHDPIFRHAQRFRAGVEGTISYLKQVLGSRSRRQGLSAPLYSRGFTPTLQRQLQLSGLLDHDFVETSGPMALSFVRPFGRASRRDLLWPRLTSRSADVTAWPFQA
jgi:hypothetical protein